MALSRLSAALMSTVCQPRYSASLHTSLHHWSSSGLRQCNIDRRLKSRSVYQRGLGIAEKIAEHAAIRRRAVLTKPQAHPGMQASTISAEQQVQKRQKIENASAQLQANLQAIVTAPVKQPQKQKAKKKRPMTAELQLIVDVQAAAKTKQPSIGLAAYNKAIAEGTRISPDLYSTLLYLCAGGDDWELPLRQQLVETSPLVEEIIRMAEADEPEGQNAGDADLAADAANASQNSEASQQQQPPHASTAASNGNGHPAPAVGAGSASAAGLLDPSTATASDGMSPTAAEPIDSSATGPAPQAEEDASTVASISGRDMPTMSAAELHSAGRSIFADMQGQQPKAMELAYTALARMAAGNGDGDAALQAAKEGQRAGVPARLRAFAPALLAYAVAGQVEKAFQVAEAVQQQKLDLTEAEFALLLQACARGAAPWGQVRALLAQMTKELTRLQPGTLAAAEQYFRSEAAAAELKPSGALAGKGRAWLVEPCTVSGSGQTSNCGGQLQGLDLEEPEWEQFAEGIAQLATKQERKPKDFEAFKAWLAEHGPKHVLVDGANVALYGQNWEHGGFTFGQIKGVLDRLADAHPDLKPLLMLHAGRTKGAAAESKQGKALLAEVRQQDAFYATPFGSNDDWYWMYAAAKAGPKGLLISNDEMRDHLFQLLAPRFFHKWKQRHQVKFTFGEAGLKLHYPAIYTTCTQALSNGSYVFPGPSGNAWLSARPQPLE